MNHYYAEFIADNGLQRKFYYYSSRLALASHIREVHGDCVYLRIELV